jgi:hypothetical protein
MGQNQSLIQTLRNETYLLRTYCYCSYLTNSLFAQSVTISTTDPSPITPAFGTPLNVNPVNGFSSSSTGTFNEFPNNKTTTIVSPQYFYTTPQTVVYFKYNFTIAAAGGPTNVAAPVVNLTYGSTTITATASPLSISNGTADYYFTFNLGTTLPANINFTISLTMSVIPGDRTVRANSLTTNAQLAVSGGSPLPVKLVNFQGALNKNTVQLTWLIAENETAKSFEVQRSTNGADFITVAVIEGSKKTGDEAYNYSEATSSARVLYRLKMYDVDSKAEYSRTLVFNTSNTSNRSLQVLTNPVKDKLVISFKNETSEVAQVNIYDNVGRVMQRQNLNVSQGINTNTISLSGNYRSGLYIVEVITKAGKLSEKVIYSNQ